MTALNQCMIDLATEIQSAIEFGISVGGSTELSKIEV
jgi:hypothetical protein